MMVRIKWLSILLSLSLGANFWFIYRWQSNQVSPSTSVKTHSEVSISALPNNQWSQNISGIAATQEQQIAVKEAASSSDYKQNEESHLNYLQSLAKQQNYELLAFEVQAYLRLYSDDVSALLLEAEAYLHTKPLSDAIIHYKALLAYPLTAEQIEQVNKLIEVNTTRVIQQFTGDRAWDVLAEFLEPLVQIDPLNRQYLMALASAYGMQENFTLMENVLAAFEPNDPRAIRLRENIITRLNQQGNGEPAPQETVDSQDIMLDDNDRQPDMILKQRRGQFIAFAAFDSVKVNLLLDTGASTTAISDFKFNQIANAEREFLGQFTVSTAGGNIQAPIYKIKELKLGRQTLLNTSVIVLPAENLKSFDGLLGMNVLSQFDLSFDSQSQVMKMYKKTSS